MKIIKQKQYWLDHFNDEKYVKIRNNIINSFKDLIFDEGPHKYYLHGEEMECVSNITHLFKPHFDEEKMAHDTYVRNYNKEGSKYYHMTPEMIIESWHNISKEACSTGTDRHNFGESVFWWMVGEYDKIVPEFKDRFKINENGERYVESIFPKEDAILSYWEDLPISYMPILAENKVFNKNKYYSYAGTFDIAFYYDPEIDGGNKKFEGIQIHDYKTNKDSYKNFGGETLLEPFEDLLDMSLNIYKLQLAAYQLSLETIGLKVTARRLIWLKPNGCYEKVPIEEIKNKLDEGLKMKFKKNGQ